MLRELELRQFRCHSLLRARFAPGWNLILGCNGEGKSSILEAIYYLGRLKSFRTAQTRELVQWQKEGFSLSLIQDLGTQQEELSIRWEKGARACFLGGQPVERLEEFWGRLPLVLLAMDDQLLIRGPAARRQQWIDSLIAYRDPRYLSLVQRYNLALRQRNSWLRQGAGDQRLGKVLSEQLAETGAQITQARTGTVGELQPILHELAGRLLRADRSFTLEYRSSLIPGQPPDWGRVEESERRLGRTLLGPHRDELILTMRDRSLARFGSEGEQRLGSLLLRLTEIHAIHGFRGAWPLVLIDDVLNPLDAGRQLAWIREIPPEVQVIFTSTGQRSDFATPTNSSVWELRQGALYQL